MRRRRPASPDSWLPRPSAAELTAPTLSGRAARLLAEGPLDPVTLMRAVCRLDRLRPDAAGAMAEALLGTRPEFVQLDDDRWALVDGTRVVGEGPTAAGQAGAAPFAERPVAGPWGEPFAVVDVETTGSQAGLWDRITEIAIVPVADGRVGEAWSQLVHPGRRIPPMITALTGISDAMVASAPRFGEIVEEVLTRLSGRVFVAHNAAFDRRFVDAELRRACGRQLVGASLCTVRLTRRLVPALPRRSLDQVAAYFGIRLVDRHRAAGDALATAHVLVRLLEIAASGDAAPWSTIARALGAPPRRPARPFPLPPEDACP
jgi:DNA polymerase-3 subunit epsilon